MDSLMEFFPIIIYTLSIIIMVLLMVLIVKLIHTVDKANVILDDVEKKTKSLNGLFSVIDGVTDTLSVFTDTAVSTIVHIFSKILPKKRKKKMKKEILEDE